MSPDDPTEDQFRESATTLNLLPMRMPKARDISTASDEARHMTVAPLPARMER